MPTRIPGVPYAAAPSAEASAKALAWPPRLIVIHDTGNPTSTKEQEASYAHTRPVKGATSAHTYVDNGGVLGSLRLDRQAWAAYGYANANGLHIEMCLRGDRTRTRQITAGLVRQLCEMAGIPMVKLSPAQVAAGARGVCGHRDITIGLGVGDHTDPGADFPWPQFMAWVTQGGAAAAAEGDDVSTVTDAIIAAWARGGTEVPGFGSIEPPKWRTRDEAWQAQTTAAIAAIAAKVDIDPAELAAIQESARAGAVEAVAAGREQLIAAIVQAVGGVAASDGNVDDAAVEAAVRRVFADAAQA